MDRETELDSANMRRRDTKLQVEALGKCATKADFVRFISSINLWDAQANHRLADEAVMAFLRSVGHSEIADAWGKAIS